MAHKIWNTSPNYVLAMHHSTLEPGGSKGVDSLCGLRGLAGSVVLLTYDVMRS